jgi:hypothetical protein
LEVWGRTNHLARQVLRLGRETDGLLS